MTLAFLTETDERVIIGLAVLAFSYFAFFRK